VNERISDLLLSRVRELAFPTPLCYHTRRLRLMCFGEVGQAFITEVYPIGKYGIS
jgi:hypothetical protein